MSEKRLNLRKMAAGVAFLAVVTMFSGYLNGQNLVPNQKKDKWGYVNETEKVVVKHKYDEAREFSEGVAAVMLKDKSGLEKWGFIDNLGKEVIPLIYDGGVGDFSEGLARVKSNGKLGFIDKIGKEIIPLKYDATSLFSGGMAMVKQNGKVGFIDKTGKELIPIKYDEIGNFSEEGLAKVKIGYNWGFIDKNGKEIIPVKYYSIGNFSKEGLAKVKSGNYWGFIDKTGKEVIPANYDEIGDFSKEGLAKVKRYDGSWSRFGFIDKTGKEIIPLKYYDASNFINGYVAVKYATQRLGFNVDRDAIWGIIDKTGKEILPGEYKEAEVMKMLNDGSLLGKVQEKNQKLQEVETLIEEAEAVLDNDYYSPDCHPVKVLEELRKKLEKLENELPADFNNMEKKSYLLKLQTGLSNAIRAQTMTKKYGAATAKKIMDENYEIGMTKEIVEEIIGVNKFYYKKSITTLAGKQSEIWEFDYNADALKIYELKVKNNLKAKCPTFVFRDGKLTDILR